MATRLRKLEITKVDLCKAGADPDAHIEIFKSRDHAEHPSDMNKEHQMSKKVVPVDFSKATPEEVVAYAKSLETQVTELTKAAKPQDDEEAEGEEEPKGKKSKNPFAKSVATEDIQKMIDAQVQEAVAKAKQENDTLKDEIAKEREAREISDIAKSVEKEMPNVPGDTTAIAKALHEVRTKLTKPSADVVEKALKAGSEAIGKAAKEVGSSGDGVAKSAMDEINSKADELVAKETNLSKPEAISRVAKSNPELYKRYQAERSK